MKGNLVVTKEKKRSKYRFYMIAYEDMQSCNKIFGF